MQKTPWLVVEEADDTTAIQRQFGQGEIVDQFPSKDHAIFLVQSPKASAAPQHGSPGAHLRCRHLPR